MGPECTVSLRLVRRDVLSLIKELHVLFSHKNILWGNLVSVLMDSGNVMRATKVDTKKPFERENMSLLTYSTNGSPSWAEQALWTELEESFKMHLRSFLQMQPKGIKKIFFFSLFERPNTTHRCLSFIRAV